MEARADAIRLRLDMGRQRRHELELRGCENLREAKLGGRSRQACEKKRFGFRLGEAGELRAIAIHKLETAAAAAVRIDGDTGGAQLIDIAKDRSDGNLEMSRELGRAHP